MRRSTTRDVSDRMVSVASRTTVQQADDSQLMQELALNLFSDEQQVTLEYAHDYGYTAVPKGPTSDSGNSGQGVGGGPGQGGAQDQQQRAEAFVVFLNGNRSHGLVLKVGDRRYRLQNLQPGEVANHDDQTQQRHIARSGIYDSVPNGMGVHARVMKSSDNVKGNKGLGQSAWQPKKPYAFHKIDRNSRTVQHPQAIFHELMDAATQSIVQHLVSLTQNGGVVASAQQGAHVLTILNGLFRQSTTTILDTAPAIGHDGPTSITGTLGVSQIVTALGYDTSSDRRLKKQIRRARFGVETLRKIRVVEFGWKKGGGGRRIQGFIAQQLARVFPQAVRKGARRADKKPWTIDQGQLIALLVKAVQELERTVDKQGREIALLKKRDLTF